MSTQVNNVDQVNRPPNVLVYTGNNDKYFDIVSTTLKATINKNRYAIYKLTDEMVNSPWSDNSTLLFVFGDVPAAMSKVFMRFFFRFLLNGGRVLAICSDLLKVSIPHFETTEVQNASIVSMSYNEWEDVQLVHDQRINSWVANGEEKNVEILDEGGIRHSLSLEVLAKDETYGAPSLLVAEVVNGSGKAVFSQVHLERDTGSFPFIDLTAEQLKLSNQHRLEILRHLLSAHLGLNTTREEESPYTPAYLLGTSEMKRRFMDEMSPFMNGNKLERANGFTLQFSSGQEDGVNASEVLLPVFESESPINFSSERYFEVLETERIGRVMIFSDVMTSSMHVVRGVNPMPGGLAVVVRQQTQGIGRGGNLWLSPLGCAMYSLQLHLPLESNLSKSISIIQHLAAMASVMAVKSGPGYEDIPIGVKWPNDICMLEGCKKIGGILVEAATYGSSSVIIIGGGLNLSNKYPTACVNDVIQTYNKEKGTNLEELDRETYLAETFNQLERLLERFEEEGGPTAVVNDYYKYWMHENANVTVLNEHKERQRATIVGIDKHGYLKARLESSGEEINLHPDGNSFDMLEGLIYAKRN